MPPYLNRFVEIKSCILLLCIIMVGFSAKCSVITPLSSNIVIDLNSTGNKTLLLGDLATISGAVGEPVIQITPSQLTCADLGNRSVTVMVTDANGVQSQQIEITVESPLIITYPTGVYQAPAYEGCIALLPDFTRIMHVTGNCSNKVVFSQSLPENSQVSPYLNNVTEVTLTARDDLGNVASTVLKVVTDKISATPKITASATETVICAGTSPLFSYAITGTNYHNGYWSVNGVPYKGLYQDVFSPDGLKDGDVVSYGILVPCGDSIRSNQLIIHVIPLTPPVLTITPSQSAVCPGQLQSFVTKLSYDLTNKNYNWKLNENTLPESGNSVSSTTLKNGDILTCTITGDSPCQPNITVSGHYSVAVKDIIVPLVSITPGNTSLCYGESLKFIATGINAGLNPVYTWRINGQETTNHDQSFTTDPLTVGTTIDCVLFNPESCSTPVASKQSKIIVNDLPVITITPPSEIEPGSTVKLSPIITGDIRTYNWVPSSTLSDPAVPNPIARPLKTTMYQLTVTTIDGCTATGFVEVKVYQELKIPNAFTPNGDGINDNWAIIGLLDYPNNKVQVFNRYGIMVYERKDYDNSWNGTSRGLPLPVGVYYYIIVEDEQKFSRQFSGSITIIR